MTVIRALELARQNGYVGPDDPLCFLEPTFFQSLGKVMGWKLKNDLFQTHDTVCVDYKSNYIDEWLYQWYQFVNTLAAGNTPEEYFKSLN